MRIGLITTIGQNIGDDFIKLGLMRAVGEALQSDKVEFVTLDKTLPFLALPPGHIGRWIERLPKGRKPLHKAAHQLFSYKGGTIFDDCDAVIQCGAPILWKNFSQDSWPSIIWEGILPAYKRLERPIINAAGGSCYPWRERDDVTPSPGDVALVRRMADVATTTTVRDDLCESIFRQCGKTVERIQCSALLSSPGPYANSEAERDTVLVNYMPGGGHFDFGQKIDPVSWEKTVRSLVERLSSRHRVAFVCHNARERDAALALNLPADVVLPEDYDAYFALAKRAKAGVFNRMHAAVSLAGMGVPSVAIGNDTRLLMVAQCGLQTIFTSDATVDGLEQIVEDLISRRAEEEERLAALRTTVQRRYTAVMAGLG